MTVMLVILWVFASLRCDDDDDMMYIRLFSYDRPVVVRCKGVRLGMGWVGSFIWWVGLDWVDENRPTDNSGVANALETCYTCVITPNFVAPPQTVWVVGKWSQKLTHESQAACAIAIRQHPYLLFGWLACTRGQPPQTPAKKRGYTWACLLIYHRTAFMDSITDSNFMRSTVF